MSHKLHKGPFKNGSCPLEWQHEGLFIVQLMFMDRFFKTQITHDTHGKLKQQTLNTRVLSKHNPVSNKSQVPTHVQVFIIIGQAKLGGIANG